LKEAGMRVRREPREQETPAPPAGNDAAVGDESAALRARAAALLAAADEAIGRALSRDSAEFLSRNRQSGGQ
jgi:hypothetical protein